MCTQRSPYNWSRELYQRHGETIENYLRATVLPALAAKSGQGGTILLTELQHRWSNHEIMNKWLKKFFTYLDRYYVKHHSLPTLCQAGLRNFRTTVYEHVKEDATAAILDLINDEREGRIIDKTLVKSIVDPSMLTIPIWKNLSSIRRVNTMPRNDKSGSIRTRLLTISSRRKPLSMKRETVSSTISIHLLNPNFSRCAKKKFWKRSK
jgi:hypothetical protein